MTDGDRPLSASTEDEDLTTRLTPGPAIRTDAGRALVMGDATNGSTQLDEGRVMGHRKGAGLGHLTGLLLLAR